MLNQANVGTLPAAPAAVAPGRVAAPGWLDAAEALQSSASRPGVVGVDVLLLLLALSVAGDERTAAMAGVAGFLAGAWVSRVYRRRMTVETQGLVWYARLLPIPLMVMLGALAVSDGQPSRWVVSAAVAAAVLVTSRAAAWVVVSRGRRREIGLRNTIVVGTADRLRQLHRRLDGFPETGLRALAAVTVDAPNHFLHLEEERARTLLRLGQIDQVLVTDASELERVGGWGPADIREGADLDCALVLPAGSGPRAFGARIGDLNVVPLGRLMPGRPRMWSKRVFDVVIALSLLVLLAPVFAIVSLAVWLNDRGPVFYRQWRVGLDGQRFRIWKFRSMVPAADELADNLVHANVADGLLFKIPDDPRVTPVGALIRRLSIDELPQFFNVVRGDMSLVGPRPLPVDPEDFNGLAQRRHLVRPGITGLWQVAGGHVVDYDDMIRLDLAYVDGWSLRQDIALLVMTIPAVLIRRSAY